MTPKSIVPTAIIPRAIVSKVIIPTAIVPKNRAPRINSKGQIEIAFNWIYILIAGAVILLFFVGIVVKQKTVSEQNLATEVVRLLDSIFIAASSADQSKIFLDTQGLKDYTLYFNCEGGVSEYGIKGQGLPLQNEIDPVFAPLEFNTRGLILWSLPYKFPYKVIDFLFLSPQGMKYLLLGSGVSNSLDDFKHNFISAAEDLNPNLRLEVVELNSVSDLNDLAVNSNELLRIVDFDGDIIIENSPIPSQFLNSEVSVVQFKTDGQNKAVYYYKKGKNGNWERLKNFDPVKPVPIVSLDEEDTAKYAAIFSGNDETYWCNMQKALVRLGLVNKVYSLKTEQIINYYEQDNLLEPAKIVNQCRFLLNAQGDQEVNVPSNNINSNNFNQNNFLPGNLNKDLGSIAGSISGCTELKQCADLIMAARRLNSADQLLPDYSCKNLFSS